MKETNLREKLFDTLFFSEQFVCEFTQSTVQSIYSAIYIYSIAHTQGR
jgi:hypothetical protein